MLRMMVVVVLLLPASFLSKNWCSLVLQLLLPVSPIMSSRVSCTCSPCVKPLAQLLPAPPPSLEMKMFSGLNKLRMSDV